MISLRITGLYNRGQQDEYVELEAAARCSLEGLLKHLLEKGELGDVKVTPNHASTRSFI